MTRVVSAPNVARVRVGPPVAAILAFGAVMGLSGCTTVYRPVRGASLVPSAPDYARKPGSIAATAPDPSHDVGWTRTVHATPPRVAVHGGALALDGGLDLSADGYVGARVAWPLRPALEFEVPVVVATVSRRRVDPAPPTSTAPPSRTTRCGTLVFVEPGLAWPRDGFVLGRPLEARVGAGVGLACFSGFGDDDVAPSGRVTGTVGVRLSSRLVVFLDAEAHAVFTDVGRRDRTLRPVGSAGLGLSWDF